MDRTPFLIPISIELYWHVEGASGIFLILLFGIGKLTSTVY